MNLDNFKLAAPPTQGFTVECEVCNELFETSESRAIEYEQFCSTTCENEAQYLTGVDPSDDNDHINNQDK